MSSDKVFIHFIYKTILCVILLYLGISFQKIEGKLVEGVTSLFLYPDRRNQALNISLSIMAYIFCYWMKWEHKNDI